MTTIGDIRTWLEANGFGRFADQFEASEVDADALLVLDEGHLKELGIPLGPRVKLLEAIKALRATRPAPSASSTPGIAPMPSGEGHAEAERRQLTVMFVDLVGSTALSARLDPEDMRDVIRRYQNAVAGEIARFGGHVAKFMGDGVLAYFGWPRAHEDDAERAVRAGLDLVEAVAALAAPGSTSGGRQGREPLAARIGIATGVVVVGDRVGEGAAQEEAVVGETPNLAARLQDLAEPGQMVIAATTRRLVGAGFEIENLGPRELKGIGAPMEVFAVTGERTMASRFEARGGPTLLPMVGRDQELALLVERWALARAGEGQGVLLVGEAGIGKSRITRALLDALADEPHTRIRYQCSPYHGDSAFWPVIQQLTHAAGIAADDPDDARLDRLEALLGQAVDDVVASAPLIADLIGLDGSARYGALDLAPQVQRTRTLAALVGQLLGLAAREPVLIVLEDAHWIDPTTLEMIEQGLDRIADARVLILLTSRPDEQPALAAHPHVTRLTLNRLGRAGVEAIVTRLSDLSLPGAIIDTIIAKTDGVPLFVEELTKAIVETGETAIPASLHDSLMARLDRIPQVKEIAQIAACIGREFPQALLAAVAAHSQPDLAAALDRLVGAELVFRRGTPPEASYSFKHALVRDAAYESLLRSRRQEIHAQLLEALQQGGAAAPEILAHHAEGAGMHELAIGHWQQAAGLAKERSAYREAARHHERTLDAIARLPERTEWLERSIDTKLELRNCLVPLGERERALGFAREAAAQAERLDDGPRRARAASYVSVMLFHVGAPQDGLDLGREAVERASRLSDVGLQVSSRFFLGQVTHALGHYGEARQLYEQAIAALTGARLYDRCNMPFLPASHARAWLAMVLAEQGDFEAGVRIGSEAVRIAEEGNQPFSQQQAYWGLGGLYFRRGELSRSRTLLEQAITVTHTWGLDVMHATIAASLGLVRALEGDTGEGVHLLESVVQRLERESSSIFHAHALLSLARAYLSADRADAAAASAERALALTQERRQAGDEAWTLHLLGEIGLRGEGADLERVATLFRQAGSKARELGMRPLEVHCTLGLALVDHASGGARAAGIGIRRAIQAYEALAMPAPAAEAEQLAGELGLNSES